MFFRFPGQKRGKYKAIISTNIELTPKEILELYLQRGGIEVTIKDLKQYLGLNQCQASKYSHMIADFTIRCIFYIMLCSLREKTPQKSIYQILLEFNQEFEDHCLDVFIKYVTKKTIEAFLDYAMSIGIVLVKDLRDRLDETLNEFYKNDVYEEKIVDFDEHIKKRKNITYSNIKY